MVVLYSEKESDLKLLGPDTVHQALFGDEQFNYLIPEGGGEPIPTGTSRTNKFLRPDANTIISAVACLQEPGSNRFFVFHNPYAENKLPLFLFADGEAAQFVPERISGKGSVLMPYKLTL